MTARFQDLNCVFSILLDLHGNAKEDILLDIAFFVEIEFLDEPFGRGGVDQ